MLACAHGLLIIVYSHFDLNCNLFLSSPLSEAAEEGAALLNSYLGHAQCVAFPLLCSHARMDFWLLLTTMPSVALILYFIFVFRCTRNSGCGWIQCPVCDEDICLIHLCLHVHKDFRLWLNSMPSVWWRHTFIHLCLQVHRDFRLWLTSMPSVWWRHTFYSFVFAGA